MPSPRAVAALCATFLLAVPGCRLPNDVAAEVNGRAIATSELEAAVRAFTGSLGRVPPDFEPSLPRVRRDLLERLIDRELMLQEAERRGVRVPAEQVDLAVAAAGRGMTDREFDATLAEAGTDRAGWRRAAEQDLAIAALQRAVVADVAVREDEVAARRARRRGPGRRPEQVRASQILVRTAAEARTARAAVLAGEPFAEVARRVSLSPDAAKGGDLGTFARGRMPAEFDAVVFDLPPGSPSEVVETPFGFHIFLVTERRPARDPTEEELRGEARDALLAEKRESAFRTWLAGLRKGAKVRYNPRVVPR